MNPMNLDPAEQAVYAAAFGAAFVASKGNPAVASREAARAVSAFQRECGRYRPAPLSSDLAPFGGID